MSPTSRPMLNTFPTEFLVAIFEDLDYDDLKLSIPLVCKRFRNILHIALEPKRSHTRQNLFVDEPNLNFPTLDTLYLHLENFEMDEFMPTNTLPTSDFQPHPMFKSMMIDHSRFQNGRPDTHLDLILMSNRPIEVESRDYKLLLENAITPAVGPRFIHFEQHSSIGVLSAVRRTEITPCLRKAVRVIDILTAIARMVYEMLSYIDSIRKAIPRRRRSGLYEEFAALWEEAKFDSKWNGDLEVRIDEKGYVHIVVLWEWMVESS